MEDIRAEGTNTKKKLPDDIQDSVKFYHGQSYQNLGENQYEVDIILDPSLDPSWKELINEATRDINRAATGIHLKVIGQKGEVESCHDNITIKGVTEEKEGSYTEGNVICDDHCEITLNDHWPEDRKFGTALHEMMHAFGAEHEHERCDAEKHLDFNIDGLDEEIKEQIVPKSDNLGVSRFDPFSVMLYPCYNVIKRKEGGDTVWDLKKHDDQCQKLSELDKLGLNILIRPVPSREYQPSLSKITGLNYCGRAVMSIEHSGIPEKLFQKICGPDTGPNCPSCRVLKTKKSQEFEAIGKWQGWTGYVYCGKKNGNGKIVCGLDNGVSCADCYQVLYPV